ncbi:uncharacterized protein AB675_8694 [Cyphellophora attinorum]|uniref:SPX domain-containing protein n=1 Tax=Cyphellophora attinorum TaxID=1664694 RepID=A0A0N1HFN6_9EURO|nr:uncharacterized protein AB675_8694 [Phialophora attinorum]KPI44634.1 hypothetical protein AB675_8694 [Phialophora attinorum]
MKFGDTLFERSVPKYAPYNVKYNELKHLIKQRTSVGAALPVSIPSASTSRWHDLETELLSVIKREYEDVSLFLRSKQGEIDRRLAYLEKQVNAASRAISADIDRPVTQARKYQRLVKDADGIGDEIELLSRFTAVQKTAFRKILKKYRKWTGSTELQTRLDIEVFSSGALQVDYAEYLNRLASLTATISTKLQAPMLTGNEVQRTKRRTGRTLSQSNAKTINDMCLKGSLQFDTALDQVPYGESGGSAYFWIHPENLEQAETLLLRHMRLQPRSSTSRQSPAQSSTDLSKVSCSTTAAAYQAIFDNAQRFVRDSSSVKPSRAALVSRWDENTEAVVTLNNLTHNSEQTSTLSVKRKRLDGLMHSSKANGHASPVPKSEADKIRDYLSENRDVKPLAVAVSDRARFSGPNNTKDVGTWAALDTSITFADPATISYGQIGAISSMETFPHAVLHLRWEFTRLPEIVRVLEASHLAERVHSFSLEQAAVVSINKDLPQPQWRELLVNDIRRVPALVQRKSATSTRRKDSQLQVPSSSGPSSTGDSIFSAGQGGQSSATEVESNRSPTRTGANDDATSPSAKDSRKSKRKTTRFSTPPQQPAPTRYWNEFDDGDSDTHPEERYAIYIDPNEPVFPGAETVQKVFSGMYDSISKGGKRLTSWMPVRMHEAKTTSDGERRPLLFSKASRKGSSDANLESSGSDTDDFTPTPSKRNRRSTISRPPYAPGRRLSKRQKAREATLQQSYIALLVLAYIFLLVAGILLGTGRKKKRLEVDAGVVTGIVAAWACVGISVVLICMRRQKIGPIHWGIFAIQVAVVIVVGVGQLVLMLGNATAV